MKKFRTKHALAKYSLEIKLAAIYDYLGGVESFKDIAQKQKHNVGLTMLKNWVSRFRNHGIEAFQKSYTNYTLEFKMDVLNYINDTGASFEEATSTFNIPSASTVKVWKLLFDSQGINTLQSKKKGRPPMKKESKNLTVIQIR